MTGSAKQTHTSPGPSPAGVEWRGRAELRREVRRKLAFPGDDAALRVAELRRILQLLERLDNSIDFDEHTRTEDH